MAQTYLQTTKLRWLQVLLWCLLSDVWNQFLPNSSNECLREHPYILSAKWTWLVGSKKSHFCWHLALYSCWDMVVSEKFKNRFKWTIASSIHRAWVSTGSVGAWYPPKFWTSPLAPADFDVLNSNWRPQSSFNVTSGTLSFKSLTQTLIQIVRQ